MGNVRPFKGIISEQAGDRLKDSTRLSIFELKCGIEERQCNEQRGEAESHLDEIAKIATEQFLPQKPRRRSAQSVPSELGGVMAEKVVQGTSNQDSLGLRTREEARNCETAVVSIQGNRRAEGRRHHWR